MLCWQGSTALVVRAGCFRLHSMTLIGLGRVAAISAVLRLLPHNRECSSRELGKEHAKPLSNFQWRVQPAAHCHYIASLEPTASSHCINREFVAPGVTVPSLCCYRKYAHLMTVWLHIPRSADIALLLQKVCAPDDGVVTYSSLSRYRSAATESMRT
jgi:hypothetical protein